MRYLASLLLLVPLSAPSAPPSSYDADAAIALALATFSPSTPVCDCGCAETGVCKCAKCPDVIRHPVAAKPLPETVQWADADFDAAKAKAASLGRPIYIEVTGPDCVYCRQMESTTFADPALAGLINSRFVPMKIDTAKHPAFAKSLFVTRLPARFIYGPNGVLAWSETGYRDARALATELTSSVDVHPVNVGTSAPAATPNLVGSAVPASRGDYYPVLYVQPQMMRMAQPCRSCGH